MKVIIVRQGQTDENVNKLIAGQGIDSLLSKEGIEQAKKLGLHLKNEKIDIAYASDQKRAVQTLEHILEFHPQIKAVKDKKLRERSYGEFEGKPSKEAWEIMKKSPLAFELVKPKGGESTSDVHKRVGKFFNSLLEKHKDETVLIVSHGRAIALLLLHILGKPIHEENQTAHRPENTAIAILELSENQPVKVHTLNNLEHLN